MEFQEMNSLTNHKFSFKKSFIFASAFFITIFLYSSPAYSSCIEGDCMNGQGIKIWDKGAKYIGSFKNGKRDGSGTHFYANGNRYEGNWKSDVKNGSGRLFYDNGKTFEMEVDQVSRGQLWKITKKSSLSREN
jgi:hypothetical protein